MCARQRGLTLIELLVVIAIIAILAAIGIPNLQDFIRSNQLTTQANDIVAGLSLARAEAVRQNRQVTFCRSDAPTAATPTCTTTSTGAWGGWIVWADLNGNGSIDSGEVLRTGQVTSALLNILSSPAVGSASNTISFRGDSLARDSSGSLLNSGQIRVCMASSSANNARDIALRAGGKAVTTLTTSASCAAPGN